MKVVKNKVAAPFREAEFDILYGEGISKEGDLLDLGVDHKIIEKSGAWYAFNGERMGQGRENARLFLKENKDIRQEIENRLRQGLGLPVIDPGAGARADGRRRRAARAAPSSRCRRRRRARNATRARTAVCALRCERASLSTQLSSSRPVPCPH